MFLEPEDGAKAAQEKDALNSSKPHKPLSKGVSTDTLSVDPLHSPISLLLDRLHGLNGAEEVVLLVGVFNVGVDEQ
jgi:hypothetical protein